ncbi:beta-propeller domain-containing protein [Candidatus Woesearchaeota archaeon]|nr:beta-propeller domain-containing protein [Candidatus Woesearchaeota archaeon]
MEKTSRNVFESTVLIVGMLALIAVLFLAGCQTIPPAGPGTGGTGGAGAGGGAVLTQGTFASAQLFDPTVEIEAKTFKTEEEYAAFVKRNAGGASYYYGGVRGEVMLEMDMAKSISSVAPTAAGGMDSANAAVQVNAEEGGYSTTNNQVRGVDEGDILKTDGEYIYTVTGNTVFIIKAYPGEDAEIVSTIKLKSAPQGLFINGDNLAVYGNFYDLDYFKSIDFVPRQGMTFFNVYDLSDKEEPELVEEFKFEGNYFESRMYGDYVYFITTTGTYYRHDYPTPLVIDGTVKSSIAFDRIYYFPIPYQSVQFANIHAINMDDVDEDVNSKSVAVESSQNMYMSEKNIFITYTEYINEWELRNKIMIDMIMPKLTESDKQLIDKIKQTDDEVLSQQEKESKILQIVQTYVGYMTEKEQQDFSDELDAELQEKLDEYEYMEYTIINKIGVDDGDISIVANGKVPGHVNNQFSMDEQDDVLRIATTISQRWSYYKGESQSTESTNNVFTLDKDLELMDSLKGLAKGEQIYSTRFMGDRLYMVTFRQVDPFFVIDLSNPKNIQELGKLKIPGFSRYLHPYDENTIIGIGRDTSATGSTRGLKISLFDVSDVENPKEIAKFVTDERYAQSTAEYEHKAFLFSKANNLLVIPAYSYSYGECWGGRCPMDEGQDYNGAMVFKVTKTEVTLRGIIDHSMANGNYNYYQAAVERSLYIQDELFTKSPNLLRINKIDDLSKVKNLELESANTVYPVY